MLGLGLSLLSTGLGLYQQEKQRREQQKLIKQQQAITNRTLMDNRLVEDQSKFRDYEYSGVPIRSLNFAKGGLLNMGNALVGVNDQGTTSGSHEQGDNIHLLNSDGQSVQTEPGEVIVDGNYALSKRNPKLGDSFADRYLKHKGESVSLLAASKKIPDVVRANELKRISQIEDTKARLIKPKQEEFNAINDRQGYAGIETNQMQAGGWLDNSRINQLKSYNDLPTDKRVQFGTYVNEELELINQIAKGQERGFKISPLVSRVFSSRPDSPRVISNNYTKSSTMEMDTLSPTIDSAIPKFKTKDFKSSNPTKQGIGTYTGDIINTGLALYESFRKPTQYPGAQLTATPSYRRLNPYGRIGGISNEVSKAMRDVDLSTSNSQVARAAKQNVLLAGMDAKNKYLSEIEDKNVANDNQFASMSANINANNAASINANNLGRYSINEARRDNLINMYSGIGASISNKLIDKRNFNSKLALDKEIHKINTDSAERVANLNSKASTEQLDIIRRISGDPEAYLIAMPDEFKTFEEFVAKYKDRDAAELKRIWDRRKTQNN